MIEEMLKKQLQKEYDEGKVRVRSGKYNPSRLGQCYRRQYWSRSGEVETNPIEVETTKIFIRGNLRGEFIQSLFPKMSSEVMVRDDDFMGFIDILTDHVVIELKSPGAWKFKSISKKKGEEDSAWRERVLYKDCPDYLYQLLFYMNHVGMNNGILCFIDESFKILEFPVRLDGRNKKLIGNEVSNVLYFWNEDAIPPAKPRLYSGKECNYCQFVDKCKDVEGSF